MERTQKGKALAAVCLLLLPLSLSAQTDNTEGDAAATDSVEVLAPGERPKPSKYIPTEKDMKQTFFQGISVSADLLNTGLYFLSSYGNLEAGVRFNLLNTYFPVAELGLGKCDKTDFNTKIHYSTNAPYLRVGLDYNVLKDKWQSNKLFVGLRYGITNFNYSFSGNPQTDPIWNVTQPLDVHSLNATSHYAEVVFGCQVKIWSFIHMGWSVRYKKEIHTTKSLYSHPYYIPGYGTTVTGAYWGATYNLTFDLNWGKKKPNVKEIVSNAVEDVKKDIKANKEENQGEASEGSESTEEIEGMGGDGETRETREI